MSSIHLFKTELPEVLIIKSVKQSDNRGDRYLSYVESDFINDRNAFVIKQETIYKIEKPNTIYGVHFQIYPKPQRKLVGVLKGSGKDYIIDLRKNSKTDKHWICIDLDDRDFNQVLVPYGFGHLFMSTEANTILKFQVDEYFNSELSKVISYRDPDIGLDIMNLECICSDQDRKAPLLKDSNYNM